MADKNHNPLNPQEQAELECRFPRAGYWFNMLPYHPEIHRPQPQPGGVVPAAAGGPVPFAQQPIHQHYVPAPGYQQPPATMPAPVHRMLIFCPFNISTRTNSSIQAPNIDVSVPLNTGVVGAVVVRVTLRLPTNIPFEDFFSRICARMDLDPLTASLGYKYASDRVRDPPHQLSNEQELWVAMEKGVNKIRHARTREVILEIHNLLPAQSAASAAGRKHTAAQSSAVGASDPDTSVSFTTELCQLKQKLQCAKHIGKYCYVDLDSNHRPLDIYQLTLWAKKILSKEATYGCPPESHAFDHVAKKPRKAAKSSGTSIEIHNHLGELLPLGDRRGQRRANTQRKPTPPPTLEQDELVPYPTISEALAELHTTYPLLDYPRYEEALTDRHVLYVDAVNNVDPDYFSAIVGMPPVAVGPFIAHAKRLARRAEKGKARALD
ncbi:hypothetical protein HWV62_38126 [Athelia sp. TMB]|nr:hypothetical protein HWV62_38126 [Athelia sp. TMB]